MSAVCRKAKLEDVEPLYQMIQGYAEKGIMLPRSKSVGETNRGIRGGRIRRKRDRLRFLMPAGK